MQTEVSAVLSFAAGRLSPEGRGSARLALRVSQLEADPYPGGQDLHILHRSCWPDEFDLVVLRPLTPRDGP